MTRDEIVKLARETYGTCATEQDYLFAEVIAAAEREACAKLIEDIEPSLHPIINITHQLAAADIRARGNT